MTAPSRPGACSACAMTASGSTSRRRSNWPKSKRASPTASNATSEPGAGGAAAALPNATPSSATSGSVFTIAPGICFVDALAAALPAETSAEPLALTRYTIRLPTRRARRSLAEAFLRQGDGRPLLLPRMMPLGDLDPDEAELFAGDEALPPAEDGAELPPPIPALRRQLLLMQAILATDPRNITADQAARLAAELARFLDQMQTEQVGFD